MFKKLIVVCLLTAPILSSAQVTYVSDAGENYCSIVADAYLSAAIDRGNGVPKIVVEGDIVRNNPDFSHKQIAEMFSYIDYVYDHQEIMATEISSHGFWLCVRKFNKE